MDRSLIAYITEKVTEIQEGTGWGEVTVVIERRKVSCIKVTDQAKVLTEGCCDVVTIK